MCKRVIGLFLGLVFLVSGVWLTAASAAANPPLAAIVIDDLGSADPTGVNELLQVKRPITFAIMPNLPNTLQEDERFSTAGYQIILHQPMEPVRGKASWLGPGAITGQMSPEQAAAVFSSNLANVPHAVGFNNHMGSLITPDKEKIKALLNIAKSKNIFVLDSCTSSHSAIPKVAAELGIPYVRRDVFLDDQKDLGAVKRQMKLLGDLAVKNGSAVAIGHTGVGGNVTAQAIKEMIPELEKRGIKFVFVSELAKKIK